jgi:hypothetical protein
MNRAKREELVPEHVVEAGLFSRRDEVDELQRDVDAEQQVADTERGREPAFSEGRFDHVPMCNPSACLHPAAECIKNG